MEVEELTEGGDGASSDVVSSAAASSKAPGGDSGQVGRLGEIETPMDQGDDNHRGQLDLELKRDEDGGIRLGQLYIPPPPPPALTFDSDRPRLVITHIENENFKSYGGVKTLGPFHKSFTSIVGPNGSGKSNVIDSMLFVFGYRAQQIRSKKVSVLIHESEQFPNVNSCSVRVHFREILDGGGDGDNDDDFTVVEGSDFYVGRTAFKDNSSFYEINGRRSPFKEVSVLLRKKGVDLDHNRFLILQGEVEQIAQMRPKGNHPGDTGMLEFLEDIIGSSRFKEPIELLKETVAELDDLRGEKLNRVKIVQKEKDELEEPKNLAVDHIRKENDLAKKRNFAFQHYIHECVVRLEKIEEERKEYEVTVADIITEVKKVASERKEVEGQQHELSEQHKQLQEKLEKAQESFQRFEIEHAKQIEDMKNANVKRRKLMRSAEAENEKLEKLQAVPDSNKNKMEEIEAIQAKLTNQVEEEQKKYDKAMEQVKTETQVYQDEKEGLETRLIGLRKNVNERNSDLQLVQNELSLLNSREEKEKCRMDQFLHNKEQCESDFQKAKEEKQQLKQEMPELEKQTKTLEKKLQELVSREERAGERAKRLRAKYEETQTTAHAVKNRGRVLESISGMDGVLGRLGDLGAIDAEYDVAVSTAAGSSLDTVLVENVNTAKRCIEYLRANSIGRANFLALDVATSKWKHKVSQSMTTPEDVPRLFDLIRPAEPRFAPAFYQYVRDTLVAKSLEQAQRIAFGARRHRVVTLSGEVIEVSGAMCGGGEKARGKMGSSVRNQPATSVEDIRKLHDECNRAAEELRVIEHEKADVETALQNKRKRLEEVAQRLQRIDFDINSFKEKLQDLTEQIKKQEVVLANAKPDKVKKSILQDKVAELQAFYDEAAAESETVEVEVRKLNAKIKEVVGNRVKSVSKKLDEAKAKLEKLKAEHTRLKVGITSAERDMEKAKDKLEGHQAEIEEVKQKMLNMSQARKDLEKEGKEVLDSLKEMKNEDKKLAAEAAKLSKELESIRVKESKSKSQQLEMKQVQEKFEDEVKEQTKTMSHWRREMKKLKLRGIPGERSDDVLPEHSPEELAEVDMLQFQAEINLVEEQLTHSQVNFGAIEEYRKKEDIYLERVAELEQVSHQKEKQRRNFEDLRKMRLEEFMSGFTIITTKLKEIYQMITLGGDAELELVDSLDPFAEGIVFSVRPPSKSWKSITNLSGGEKTLSSLALIFALHFYKPTPLYVMDEIDAALDFKNVSIVAFYIQERTRNAQFIIISLRSNMFELADRLVGIFKTCNCSESVTINPKKLAQITKEN